MPGLLYDKDIEQSVVKLEGEKEIRMEGKYSALDIANLFVDLANSVPGDSIDNLKLNKICYYAQGWSLVKLGYPLFGEKIQAWKYGPVIPEVYRAFRVCGDEPIKAPESEADERGMTSDEVSLLVDVYNTYGKYTSVALVRKTHEIGTPWRDAYKEGENNEITLDAMAKWFCESDELETFEPIISPENLVAYD